MGSEPVRVRTLSRLEQLTFKGLEGSSKEETTLAEEHVSLKGRLCFIWNGENLHCGWVCKLGEHPVANAEMVTESTLFRRISDSLVRPIQ